MSAPTIFDDLSAYFPPHRISWRVGSTNAKRLKVPVWEATEGKALAYIDARDVMNRLDEVVGPGGWQDEYYETPSGRVICNLSIRIDGEWISKADGAGSTATEGEKGGISDAFKRAAVKWGIGRYLYECEGPWVSLTNGNLPKDFDGSKYLPYSPFTSKQARTKFYRAICAAASENDSGKARETWDEMTNEQRSDIWRELSSSVRSTIKELLASTNEEEAA